MQASEETSDTRVEGMGHEGEVGHSKTEDLLPGVVERIREEFAELDRVEMEARYAVGRIISGVKQSPGKYGARAVEEIATDLGCDPSGLYDASRVADTWGPGEHEVLMARPGAKQTLTWSHLTKLASVDDDDRREALIQKILSERLSVRRLTKEIAGTQPSETDEEARPTSVRRALRGFKVEAEVLVAKVDHWTTLIFDALEADADQLDSQAMLEALGAARESRRAAKDVCEAQLAQLDECIARAEKLVGGSESAVTSGAAA